MLFSAGSSQLVVAAYQKPTTFKGECQVSIDSFPYKREQEVRDEFPAGKLMLCVRHLNKPVDHTVMWGERTGRELLTNEWREGTHSFEFTVISQKEIRKCVLPGTQMKHLANGRRNNSEPRLNKSKSTLWFYTVIKNGKARSKIGAGTKVDAFEGMSDEGKCPPLEVIKLEGAEIGIDSSLGKPFVFNCVPQSGNRTFYLCATSNQEMKRWLEAMDKAAYPVHQLAPSYHPVGSYFKCALHMHKEGGLYLQGYTVNEQTLSFKQSVIELKPPSEEFKTFYFCAENKTENQRWITALKMSIKKWLPLHQAIQDFMNRPLEETRM
eukprot:bmy_15453T0